MRRKRRGLSSIEIPIKPGVTSNNSPIARSPPAVAFNRDDIRSEDFEASLRIESPTQVNDGVRACHRDYDASIVLDGHATPSAHRVSSIVDGDSLNFTRSRST